MVAAAWSAGVDDDFSGCAGCNAADVVGEQDAEEPNGAAVRFVLTTEALGPGSAARFLIVGGFYSEIALRNEKQRAQCILNTS